MLTRWEIGGAQETVIELAKGLQVHDWTLVGFGGVPFESDHEGASTARAEGLEVHTSRHLVRRFSPAKDFLAVIELTKLIRGLRPDIVHTHGSKAGVIGRISARAARVPVIHTVHGWSFSSMTGVRRSMYVQVEKLMSYITTAFTFVADQDLSLGRELGIVDRRPSTVIRSSVDLRRFSPNQIEGLDAKRILNIPSDSQVIISVTRLAAAKAPLVLAKTLVASLTECPTTHAVVVGDGPDSQEFRRFIEGNQEVASRVHLLGTRRDIPNLLSCADLFVLTDNNGGLPRAIIEALASGVPVVTTNFAGVAEAVRHDHNGRLCDVGDVASLSRDLVELIGDEDARSRLATNARDSVARFGAEEMSKSTAHLYSRMINAGRN